MSKPKLNLDQLAKELTCLPNEKQFRIKGGGSAIVLSPIIIYGSALNDEPDPGDDPLNNDQIDDEGSSYDNPNGDGDTINDPENVIANLENQLKEYKTALEGILESGEVPAGSGITLEGIESYLESIDHLLNIIDLMENSDKAYRIEEGEVEGSPTGQTYFDTETGEYVIRLEDSNDIGLLAHELMHCEQIENGDIVFDENGNITGLSLEDEIEAFQLQHDMTHGALSEYVDFFGNPVPEGGYEITAEDVLGKYPEYADLPLLDDTGDAQGSSSSAG